MTPPCDARIYPSFSSKKKIETESIILSQMIESQRILTGEIREPLDGCRRVLSYFDQIAIGVAHVASPLVAVVIERLGEEVGPLGRPIFVAGPDVSHTQIQQAAHPVWVARRFQDHVGFVGRGSAA